MGLNLQDRTDFTPSVHEEMMMKALVSRKSPVLGVKDSCRRSQRRRNKNEPSNEFLLVRNDQLLVFVFKKKQ